MQESNDNLSFLKQMATRQQLSESTPASEESDAIAIAEMSGTHAMRPAHRNLTRIHIVDKAGKVRTFQYNHLDAMSSYEGGGFVLTFAGTKHWQVTVKGSGAKLWSIYDSITLHRCPYLREASGSLPGADGETVLTSIEFKDITPRSEE